MVIMKELATKKIEKEMMRHSKKKEKIAAVLIDRVNMPLIKHILHSPKAIIDSSNNVLFCIFFYG
jgi:hypothetical protein